MYEQATASGSVIGAVGNHCSVYYRGDNCVSAIVFPGVPALCILGGRIVTGTCKPIFQSGWRMQCCFAWNCFIALRPVRRCGKFFFACCSNAVYQLYQLELEPTGSKPDPEKTDSKTICHHMRHSFGGRSTVLLVYGKQQ